MANQKEFICAASFNSFAWLPSLTSAPTVHKVHYPQCLSRLPPLSLITLPIRPYAVWLVLGTSFPHLKYFSPPAPRVFCSLWSPKFAQTLERLRTRFLFTSSFLAYYYRYFHAAFCTGTDSPHA